jgi:hypothetical protein
MDGLDGAHRPKRDYSCREDFVNSTNSCRQPENTAVGYPFQPRYSRRSSAPAPCGPPGPQTELRKAPNVFFVRCGEIVEARVIHSAQQLMIKPIGPSAGPVFL